MTYDAVRQRVVLFGGVDYSSGSAIILSDTWEWDGVNWVQARPAASPSAGGHLAYDEARQQVVLFGGTSGQETWTWNGVDWLQATPARSPFARGGTAMAYHTTRQRVVLFGGVDRVYPGFLGDEWEWDGVNWAQRHSWPQPQGRGGHAMAYDAARQRVVMYGGEDDSVDNYFWDTWEWDGVNWIAAAPLAFPPGRASHVMAYDAHRQRVVLFGGCNYGGCSAETWEYRSLSPASFAPFGSGCPGSMGIPTLSAAPHSSPWAGDNYSIELSNLPPGNMTFLVTGLSNTFWSGALIPLPSPLTSWGMPGCTVYTDVLDSELLSNTAGTAVWTKTIPVNPMLVGMPFYNQAWVVDPGVNAMGATVSHGGQATIGMR